MNRSLKIALASLLVLALLVLSVVAAKNAGVGTSSNTTRTVTSQLARTTTAVTPYLGITYLPITPEVAAYYGLAQQDGIYICEVANGSPAYIAGVAPNSIMTRFDGTTLDGDTSIVELLKQHQAGDSVKLSVVRADSTSGKEVTVVLAATPGE